MSETTTNKKNEIDELREKLEVSESVRKAVVARVVEVEEQLVVATKRAEKAESLLKDWIAYIDFGRSDGWRHYQRTKEFLAAYELTKGELVMPNIIVETRKYPEQNGKVVAEITDNGYVQLRVEGRAGLSPAVLRQLADLADAATREPAKGA